MITAMISYLTIRLIMITVATLVILGKDSMIPLIDGLVMDKLIVIL